MAGRKGEFLKFLRFDPKLRSSRIANYLANPRLVILILLLVIILGLNAFLTLPRNLNPEVKIPIVLVSTVLPGAGPSDIESLITKPIEDSVNSLEDVKTITSSSLENVSTVTIEFESGVDPEKAKTDVQSSVDSISDFPEDATTPQVIKLDFENAPIWTFVLTGTTDDASLFKFAKNLKEKLEALPEIDDVGIAGLEDNEIKIVINPEVYASFGISPFQLSSAITAGFKSFPAGSIRTESSNFSLAIDPQIVSIEDIRT
jgi:multidrug efflux pump subunit AcrB